MFRTGWLKKLNPLCLIVDLFTCTILHMILADRETQDLHRNENHLLNETMHDFRRMIKSLLVLKYVIVAYETYTFGDNVKKLSGC